MPTDSPPSVSIIGPGQQRLTTIECRPVTPRVSDDWLSQLLEELLPHATAPIRRLAAELYGDQVIQEHRYPLSFPFEKLAEYGIDPLYPTSTHAHESGLHGDYAAAISEYAICYHDRGTDDIHRSTRRDDLHDFLTSVGTGTDPFNSGVDALEATIAPIFESLAPDVGCKRPSVRLYLDATEWVDVDDARTARRALDAIAALGQGLEIELVVASPKLAKTLFRRHSEWLESVTGLTSFREWSETCGAMSKSITDDSPVTATDATQREIIADALAKLSDGSGRVRLLAAVQAGERTVKTLKRDPDVNLAAGSIDRYVRELETEGLLAIEEAADRSNRVSLTAAGQIVVDHIGADYSIRSPSQSVFQQRSYSDPSPQRKYSVLSAARSGGGEEVLSPDEWLAATGTADGPDGEYVQWLSGPDEQIDAFGQHKRLTAGKQTDGVNLVDASIEQFEDGRTTYVSCFDDEFLTVVQWGGPLVTLGRLANSLLSRKALSKVLNADAVGFEFENLFGGVSKYNSFDADLEELIRMGLQVGWYEENETEWDGWFDRITGVRAALMKELGEVVGSNDSDRRAELFRDLHGLIATATAMYEAAGVDVTIDLRIPDIHQLITDDYRFDQFLRFCQKTVTKQAIYRSETGHHSWYRTCIEPREKKLKYRLSPGYSLDNPHADLTASWIIRGPTATDLQEPIQEAIETEIAEIRKRVTEGTEAAPILEVPIVDATTLPHIRAVARELASLKNYQLQGVNEYINTRFTDREFGKFCIGYLATSDNPHGCNPSDVAEALLRLSKTEFAGDRLTRRDLEYALSQLPADRLLPEKLPSKTKIFQELLAAGKPLGRSDLIERTRISESTYDRHISDVREELRAIGLLKIVSINGYKRMVASIEPYWARDADCGLASDLDHDVVDTIDAVVGEHAPGLSRRSRRKDVLFEVAAALDLDLQSRVWNLGSPLKEVYELHPALSSWRPLLFGIFGSLDELTVDRQQMVAILGATPESISPQQTSLDSVGSDSYNPQKETPGLSSRASF
jgi:hypothetical protein